MLDGNADDVWACAKSRQESIWVDKLPFAWSKTSDCVHGLTQLAGVMCRPFCGAVQVLDGVEGVDRSERSDRRDGDDAVCQIRPQHDGCGDGRLPLWRKHKFR